jgi:hypothetical protein
MSCVLVFGTFILFKLVTGPSSTYSILSNSRYPSFLFDFSCTKGGAPQSAGIACKPQKQSNSFGLTTSDVLFNFQNSSTDHGIRRDGFSNLANLLDSLILNGFPLLDLQNYGAFSDYVREFLINTTALDSIGPEFASTIGNLVNFFSSDIRFAPQNCWTDSFVNHLQNTSSAFRRINHQIFVDEAAAAPSNSDFSKVFAVILIYGECTDDGSKHNINLLR